MTKQHCYFQFLNPDNYSVKGFFRNGLKKHLSGYLNTWHKVDDNFYIFPYKSSIVDLSGCIESVENYPPHNFKFPQHVKTRNQKRNFLCNNIRGQHTSGNLPNYDSQYNCAVMKTNGNSGSLSWLNCDDGIACINFFFADVSYVKSFILKHFKDEDFYMRLIAEIESNPNWQGWY